MDVGFEWDGEGWYVILDVLKFLEIPESSVFVVELVDGMRLGCMACVQNVVTYCLSSGWSVLNRRYEYVELRCHLPHLWN